MVFLFDFLELNAILIGEISVTSLVLARACQFPLQKLAVVLIDMSFGVLISGQVVHGKFAPRCNDIQNPTLRLMHKWVRDDPRPVRNDELMILYVMVNKIRISPAQAMVKQWLKNFQMTGPIECTSLVTHIASM